MEKEIRQKTITELMSKGVSFDKVYKKSDGIPYFSWWIYPSNGIQYIEKDKSTEQTIELIKTLPNGSTYKRIDILGYSIE